MTLNHKYDPRAVANMLLSQAKDLEFEITNLSLQKLLYFVHALFLIKYRKPLLHGHFEAWKFGPVHPSVYETFKHFGPNPINHQAQAFDYATNSYKNIPEISDVRVRRIVTKVVTSLGGMKPSQLVRLTHAKGGAWHVTVNKAETSIALGLRIGDSDTKNLYGMMKLDLSAADSEEVYENSPFT